MKKYSILVVDDIPENIDILFNILKDTYEVRAATDGAKAIQIASSGKPPDIIFLDVMMPGMSGFDVCRELKSKEKTREIPVIFLTAVTEIDELVKGFELGGVDYIIKPFNAAELTTRLTTHLSLKQAAETLKNQNAVLEETVARRTELLRKKNELLEETLAKLDKLYAKIQNIQEDERKKIAMDIHDRLGQQLTVIKLNLFQIRKKADSKDAALDEKIKSTILLTDDAMRTAQSISMQIRPDILDNLGFIDALKWYCRTMQESTGIVFALATPDVPVALDKGTELSLYRIIQEAFTNIIRHSRAKKCGIDITVSAARLRIILCDDGVGIPEDKINDPDSLGLYGMRKRIEDRHGAFHIAGAPGRGTTVTLLVPLPEGAPA